VNNDKKYKSSMQIFSTNLTEEFYIHWLFYSVFTPTTNLSFYENKILEEKRMRQTFLRTTKID
jgi:hypothetical protein